MEEINVSWKEGMAFEADVEGFKLMLDAAEKFGGHHQGPRPKPLMLVALGGCTGMDVVSILSKMRIEPESFNIKVEGTKSEEQPAYYTCMHITYEFRGENLPYEMLEKAINLSLEKYCGVAALYKKAIPVTYTIITHEA